MGGMEAIGRGPGSRRKSFACFSHHQSDCDGPRGMGTMRRTQAPHQSGRIRTRLVMRWPASTCLGRKTCRTPVDGSGESAIGIECTPVRRLECIVFGIRKVTEGTSSQTRCSRSSRQGIRAVGAEWHIRVVKKGFTTELSRKLLHFRVPPLLVLLFVWGRTR